MDPNLLDDEGSGPLTSAMLAMDAEMIELLCSYGTKPNKVAGFSENEILYDWACFDYQYEVYDLNLPGHPSEKDTKNAEA